MYGQELPHRRRNPLTGEWVLVSPQRSLRPWQGARDRGLTVTRKPYDADCYLCPGNQRANEHTNPSYEHTFVFENDFPALTDPKKVSENPSISQHALFQSHIVEGICRVICFSPRHDLTLARMPTLEIQTVIDTWVHQTYELGQRYSWVQIFENKGATMGCSNAHPHGQVWASNQLPSIPFTEDRLQSQHLHESGQVLLVEYLKHELDVQERIVEATEDWVAVVPYWAIWPFEILLMPQRHVQRMNDLTTEERIDLAGILKRTLVRYDNLFGTSLPYSMGWHGAPNIGQDTSHWQLHAHFFPPLLRSAHIRKFMVGYEMLAEPQRDLTPEQAAQQLRGVPSNQHLGRMETVG